MRVRLAPRALVDFDEILDYLEAVASPRVANRYGRDIQAAINKLADFPGMGPLRSELGPGTRIMIVSPYLIFYEERIESREVVVLRILHGRRKITRDHFKPDLQK